jgi:WD40 repeat protein
MTTPLDADHPWPGPESFQPQDAGYFRGRDAEVRQLVQWVRRAHSVVLYGASGLGKTSLLNAGVIPELAADEFFAVPVRISYVAGAPSAHEQIQTEILRRRSGPGMPKARPGQTAWELLHLRAEPIEGAQPLLIFDQFEELFTIGVGTSQAAELLDELKGLIEGIPPHAVRERLEQVPAQARELAFQRSSHRVLISIREDFLHGLESLRAHLPSIIHNRFRIGPLSGTMAMEVVMQQPRPAPDGPAGAASQARSPIVDREVAELIVRTVASSEPDDRPLEALEVEPALLSILCAELARRRSNGVPITRELVSGSRTDIISTFYERALGDVPPEVRAYVEDVLVTSTGVRTSTVLVEALNSPGFTPEVLGRLVERRLLRVIERPNGKWLELTHDILTKIAAQSRGLRQERLRTEKERIARAEQQRAELAARAARDRKVKGRALAIASVLLAAFVGLGSYNSYVSSKRRAADEARSAMRQQLIDTSLRGGRYREALVQLAAVVREDPAAAWARSMAGDLLLRHGWPQPLAALVPPGPLTYMHCNVAGTRCAAAYRDGRVLVRGDLALDLVTGQTGFGGVNVSDDGSRVIFVPERPGNAIAWILGPTGVKETKIPIEVTWNSWYLSSDAKTLVLPDSERLAVWRLGDSALRTDVVRQLGNAAFVLSKDGRWLAYHDTARTIVVHDLTGGTRHPPFAIPASATKMEFTRDSKVLAVALVNGTVLRWHFPDVRPLEPLHAERPIVQLWFSNQGDRLLASLEGGALVLWLPGQTRPQEVTRFKAGVMQLVFAADDRRFVVSTRDGSVSSWDSDGVQLAEPVRHDTLAFAAPLHDGSLASGSLDGASSRWLVRSPLGIANQFKLGEPVEHAWFISEDGLFAHGRSRWVERSRAGQRSGASGSGTRTFSIDRRHSVDRYTNGLVARELTPDELAPTDSGAHLVKGMMESARFADDGRRLVAAGGGLGYLFDVPETKIAGSPIENVSDAWISPDGTLVAFKGTDLGLTLWQWAADGQLSKRVEIPALVVSHVAFAPGNAALLIVSENRARVWSLTSQAYRGLGWTHDAPILDGQFSPDGRWIVTASEDGQARIWDAASGLPASDAFSHDHSVTAAAFSPSGRRLLTADSGGNVRIWDLSGADEAGDQERLWLARVAEVLSGLQIDSATTQPVPAVHADAALLELRAEVERVCPGTSADPPACTSRTGLLVRRLLGRAAATPALAAR